jgi:hypothetical protein
MVMAAPRKKLALGAMTVADIVGVLYHAVGGRNAGHRAPESTHSESEFAEKAKQAASEVSDRLAPVVSWKLKMLRYIGWY